MCTTRDEIRAVVHEEMYATYNGVSQTISGVGREVKELAERFDKHDEKEKEYQQRVDEYLKQTQLSAKDIQSLREVIEGYTAMGTLKKMVIGFAAFCVAVGTIVGSIVGITRLLK